MSSMLLTLSRSCCFFFSSRRRHTRLQGDWSSDVCSSDLRPLWLYGRLHLHDDRRGSPRERAASGMEACGVGGGHPSGPVRARVPAVRGCRLEPLRPMGGRRALLGRRLRRVCRARGPARDTGRSDRTMNTNALAVRAPLHCLTGCAIGEVSGMAIGTAAGLDNVTTVVLAVTLAFVFGYLLTMW